MIVLRRHNVAVSVKVEKDIFKSSFHNDGKREAALLRAVYLTLEPCPSFGNRAEKIVEALALDGKAGVARDGVVTDTERADRHLGQAWVEVPGRLLSCVYRDFHWFG